MYRMLHERYPYAHCELDFDTPLQLLVATVLSAQTTDVTVNKVTPTLFARWPTARDLAAADRTEMEEVLRPTGFYRAKTNSVLKLASAIVEEHDGEVPPRLADLVKLPGVGRKTANLMLGDVFHVPGVVVADTHCIRITGLLGLTNGSKDPVKVEMQLRRVLPPEESNDFCHRLVLHGRAVCIARRPQCEGCTLRPWCDHFAKNGGQTS